MVDSQTHYQHWHYDVNPQGIGWLSLDCANSQTNVLNEAVLSELDELLTTVAHQSPKGLIIQSSKTSGFIAGADIQQFSRVKDSDHAYALIRKGQAVFDKLQALKMPTVALIDGFCLGGGLELALACRYRVASNASHTKLGLPEVKLGIHPAWGGSVRLVAKIGVFKAMPLLLSGRVLSVDRAKKRGIVDAVVPARQLKNAAIYYAQHHSSVKKISIWHQLCEKAWLRPWVARWIQQELSHNVDREHYPAPFALIKNWEKNGVGQSAQQAEASSASNLIVHSTSRNLVRVFFLQEQLKKLAKNTTFTGKYIHVIGAGTMGGDIAAWCALQGYHVSLQDQSAARIAPAMKRAAKLFQRKCGASHLRTAAWDRLQPDVVGDGLRRADVIIEAVSENVALKQKLFQQIEPQLKPSAILASNTSSIPLERLAEVLKKPEQLIGLHFFNPVAKLMLVEVVQGQASSPDIMQRAQAFVRAIKRLPLPVKSQPGFLVNRILVPYLLEAMQLLQENVPMGIIDQKARDFGMPMGPIELADSVGLDVCLSVARHLAHYYKQINVPDSLVKMVEQHYWGRKSGRGFYHYDRNKIVRNHPSENSHVPEDISDRLIFSMLNEAVACCQEKIVNSTDLIDAGMILGTGFAPFRGGPMHYLFNKGVENSYQRLQQLAAQHGERFSPHPGWQDLLKQFG